MENVEISASELSALLPVVSMHCLVLYCYLLASTKRGNESEAGRATWPAGRQGSHNNIAPFRPTSTDCADGRRGRGHTQTRRRCRASSRGGILAAAIFLSASVAFRSLDKWPLEAN